MSLLPGRLVQSAISLIFVTSILFSGNSFLARPVLAQEPDPQPCQNPIEPNPEILTHNWLVDENRIPQPPGTLHRQVVTEIGPAGSPITATHTFNFQVDFSKLGGLFGPTNSDYLEGKFQEKEHKTVNIRTLGREEVTVYNGAEIKTAPKAMLDALRVEYVNYVYNHNQLGEAGDEFSDTSGEDSMTVYDLVEEYGMPTPNDRNSADWKDGWGRYWSKIPTSYSEYYEAYIQFRSQHKALGLNNDFDESNIGAVLSGTRCPYWLDETITFVMPEYFRTTATSGQVNQITVPGAAQSNHSNDVILQNKPESANSVAGNGSVLGSIFDKCLKAFKNNPVSNALKKVISFVNTLGSINVYAEPYHPSNSSEDNLLSGNCMRVLIDGKEGLDPYCALPENQPDSDLEYECTNQIDEFKKDRDNPNVVCNFQIKWQQEMVLSAGLESRQFDECRSHPTIPGWVICDVAVSLWPIFEIPWQAEIWNNTLFSDTNQFEPYLGSENYQEKGRPGHYSFFTPITVFQDELEALIRKCKRELDTNNEACQKVINYVNDNAEDAAKEEFNTCVADGSGSGGFITNPDGMIECVLGVAMHIEKKRPGETDRGSENDLARRVIGGTDCSKEFVWHNALLDKGVQHKLNLSNECDLEGVNLPTGPLPPPIDADDELDFYIKYGDTSITVDNATKADLIALANSSWPGNNTGQWDYVVSQSLARGVSPAFTIAIWWEEGGFGGAGANSEFGCFPGGNTSLVVGFNESLECFLNFTASEHPYNPSNPQASFTEWVRYFCGPAADPICSNNPGFLSRIKSIYNSVAPGEIILSPVVIT